MKDQEGQNSSHPRREMMIAYSTDACLPDERRAIEDHCLVCPQCRIEVLVLLRRGATSPVDDEQSVLTPLLPIGLQAAARARELVKQEKRPNRHLNVLWDLLRAAFNWVTDRTRIIFRSALLIAGLLLVSLAGYLIWDRSAEERLQVRMRHAYRQARSLEARVTGNFDHQPLALTRGLNDATGADEEEVVVLLRELNQTVKTRPTAANQHLLGRLFLLQGDFDPAERQLQLALRAHPHDPRLQTDLSALYYERSRIKNYEDRESLEKAAEHISNAVELDPRSPEARFNRALIYEQMNLFSQAESEWRAYLVSDDRSAWAAEAREHLNQLRERAERLEKLEQNVQAQFLKAEGAVDEAEMRTLVARHFVPIRNLALDQFLDKYLAAAVAGEMAQAGQHLRTLERIGRLVGEIKDDQFINDTVRFAARANPAVKREVQAIRQMIQQARQEWGRGALSAALDLCVKARQGAERLGDQAHAELAAYYLVRYYNPQSESEEIVALRNQLVAETERRHHRLLHARVLLALANAEGAAQQLSLNLEHSKRAAQIAKDLGDPETAVNSLRFVSSAYARLGDYDLAEENIYEALSLMRDSPVAPTWAFAVYGEMGETLFKMGHYPRALPYLREAAQGAERAGSTAVWSYLIEKIGLSYGMLGRYQEARQHLDQAVARAAQITDEKARSLLQVDLYIQFADFYLRQNKFDEAIATYQRAITNVGVGGNRYHLSSIRQGLAKAYLAQGRDAEAETELRDSLKLAEEARDQIHDARGRSTFLASQQGLYRLMVGFQFSRKHDPAQAFNYAEIAKSRDLLDELTGSTGVSESDGQVKLMLTRSATPLTLEELRQTLPGNAQLVQYIVAENQLIIWLVSRGRVTTARVEIVADELRRLVTSFVDDLHTRGNIERIDRQSTDLYQRLIGPIAARLDPNLTLCIIPDGVLHDLPFAALVSPETHRHLVEDFALVINPSASVLARTLEISRRKQKSESEPFLGVSNPRLDQQKFPRLPALPAADRELERVTAYYPHHQVMSRKHATESALVNQIGNYEIVHLATHVLDGRQSSLLSTIALAAEGGASVKEEPHHIAFDGALRAHEIYRLKLERTRLVVLSGCRSGLGARTEEDALSGLAQSFLVAGVPTVVASLWDVDDESTAELMEKFHAAHRVKKMAFGQALRQAQLSFIQTEQVKRRHPYYWSTFIVTGDGMAD